MAEVPDIPDEKRALLEEACKNAGLRLTHQRLEIYRELVAACDHPSAETLHQRLRKRIPTLSLDTVYRTLATLAEQGLINRVETLESQAHFEATSRRHHHLDLPEMREDRGFSVAGHRLGGVAARDFRVGANRSEKCGDSRHLPQLSGGAWGKVNFFLHYQE